MNKFYTGDNLQALRSLNNACADLVYLDPPFNTNRVWTNKAGSFSDVWKWDDESSDRRAMLPMPIRSFIDYIISNGNPSMASYCVYIADRVIEIHDKLSENGVMCLHVDTTASHHLKIIMDLIFVNGSLINEIVWKRNPRAVESAKRKFSNDIDVLLVYSKGKEYTFNPVKVPLSESNQKHYSQNDNDGKGRYRTQPMQTPNPVNPGFMYDYTDTEGKVWPCPPTGWLLDEFRTRELDEKGLLYKRAPKLTRRYYLNDRLQKGQSLSNVWTDIPKVRTNHDECNGYPTQKPIALLTRIIKAFSNFDDCVLDPFAGSGTTCYAAHTLGRRWIGMDINPESHKLLMARFQNEQADPHCDHITS